MRPVHSDSRASPATFALVILCLPPRVKRSGSDANNQPASNAEVKNVLNTHFFYFVDEILMCKDILKYCFVKC